MNDLLERLCQQVREAGLSTGHADTPEQLMAEVLEQVRELRRERETIKAGSAQLRETLLQAGATISFFAHRVRTNMGWSRDCAVALSEQSALTNEALKSTEGE